MCTAHVGWGVELHSVLVLEAWAGALHVWVGSASLLKQLSQLQGSAYMYGPVISWLYLLSELQWQL